MRKFIVEGMSCAACVARVEKAVNSLAGVKSCSVSLLTNSMMVDGTATNDEIIESVIAAGYGAKAFDDDSENIIKQEEGLIQHLNKSTASFEEEILKDRETPKLKKRLVSSIVFLVILMYIGMGYSMLKLPIPKYFENNYIGLAITQMLLAIIVIVINKKFFVSGFKSIINHSPNMDSLVALGSSVSFLWSLVVLYRMCGIVTLGENTMGLMHLYHNELYFETAAMIPALITVGKMLEAMSKGKTTSALKSLMRLRPKTAIIIKDNEEAEILIDEVKKGDVFKVYPGANIPVDGVVLDGESSINEAALTGESLPVDKSVGDEVKAGTTNIFGTIICKATKVGNDTTINQIIKMVSDASATKAPIARIADTVSGVFVPAVILIAVIVVVVWIFRGENLSFALARGISVLVISCPCALGLATPVAIMVGNGVGARNGVLFKTGASLENLGKVNIVALDKTGTITKGMPEITDYYVVNAKDENDLYNFAYALEKNSEHPLAKAIINANLNHSSLDVTDFKVLAGNGVEAKINGILCHAGNKIFIEKYVKIEDVVNKKIDEFANVGKTPLLFEKENVLLGIIAVADAVKVDAKDSIDALKELNIKSVMLTGDNERTANAISKIVGVDSVVAGVLPDGKEKVITNLKKDGKVAMVGDGINDAVALVSADVGVAIGAGSDIAIDSADVVLMNNKLSDVVFAIKLSKATLKNIYENLFWAFFYNVICIPLAAGAFGFKMNPMIGALCMSLSSFTVCMNALRLNFFSIKKKSDKLENEINIKEEKNYMLVKIEGMMCPHCEARVREAFLKNENVKDAVVSHEMGTAKLVLSGDLNSEVAKKIVEDAGYKFLGVE
ncbi:MAG: heavy metal translocating P-type ATPase [Lachnospiraceae bacterium]|nr:heavy metal translocating P-type ATPase [Lachnospiraceae bacterium]